MKSQSRSYHVAREAIRQKNREFLNDEESGQMTGAVFNHCEKLHSRLWDLAIRTADELLEEVSVTANIEPTKFVAGSFSEAILQITNRSPLPLRNFSVEGEGIEDLTMPFLPAGITNHWSIRLDTSKAGKLTRLIRWSCIRLDETDVSGELEIVAAVSSPGELAKFVDLGKSPYVFARVLDEKSEIVFKGRRKPIQQILSAIDRPDASTIVLVEGNRRIGKTSLLKYFIRRHLPSDKIAVFINFQDFDGETGANARPGIPTVNVFRGMARELVRAAVEAIPGLTLPEIGTAPSESRIELISYYRKAEALIDEKSPFQSFRNLTEIVRAVIAPKCLLFLFDEFDRLQEGIESGVTSDQVPENLRHLFQTWNDLSGIFTGSRTIRRLRQEYWNVLFGLGQTVRLYGLAPEEARQLIENPVEGRLVYASNAVEEICRVTARQPLLIQGMCERLFRVCKATDTRSISLSMVENTAVEMAEDSEHFESIWTYIGTDRRRLIVFLIDEQERISKGATFERIQELLEENGLKPSAQEIHSDLEELVDLEVVHRTQNQGLAVHRIEIPLFSRWLNITKDISQYRASALEE